MNDMSTSNQRRGVRPDQIAKVLQDLGYRGFVDPSGDYVHSGAMGFDFRVTFYRPIEGTEATEYENYIFDLGTYFGSPIQMQRAALRCNVLNHRYRFTEYVCGVSEEGRCFVALQMDVFADSSDDTTLRRNCEMFTNAAATFRTFVTELEAESDSAAPAGHNRAVVLVRGDEEDRKRAAELYYKAAVRGFSGSQNNLGDLYERGLSMPLSPVMAAYWYARAAERGEPTAYLSLATLLMAEAEDNWSFIEAAKFAILAARDLPDGSRRDLAFEDLQKLADLLPDDAMDFAKKFAGEWLPLFQETRLMGDPVAESAPAAGKLLN